MTMRASHHWHVVVDDDNRPTSGVVEHEHMVNPGVRHAHYYQYDELYRAYRDGGLTDADARAFAMRRDDTAATTLDLDREPQPGYDERGVVDELHPEVRRSLS